MKTDLKISNSNLAIAALQLQTEVAFKNTNEILAAKGIDVLLLKGPHLGHTVYDGAKDRLYNDIDILVRPKDFDVAAAVLRENNFQPFAFDTFVPEIQRDFKHWEFRSPWWGVIIELHRWLSGHDRFNVDSEGLFERAEPFNFGETNALGLGKEDLLLHLCLHMGTSYFKAIERKHVLDIALLIKKKSIDWSVFLSRVRKAGAGAIAYYSLKTAQLQDGAAVPADILKALHPGRLRRLWLEKYIDPGVFPIYRFSNHSLKKIKRNLVLPLMDRPSQWGRFFTRMIGLKMRMLVRKIKEVVGR
jgi:hypothetical protein